MRFVMGAVRVDEMRWTMLVLIVAGNEHSGRQMSWHRHWNWAQHRNRFALTQLIRTTAYWRHVALVVVLWRPALSVSSSSSSASVTALRWEPVNVYIFNFWCDYGSWPWLETHKKNFWRVKVQGHTRRIADHLWMASSSFLWWASTKTKIVVDRHCG